VVFTKIESDNIYMRFLKWEDMSIITPALTGVFPGDVLPDENEQKFFYYQANKQNEALFSKRALQEGDVGWLNFAMCLNSTDAPIGYCVHFYHGTEAHYHVTALIPSERRKHYYTESIILRHRFIFDTLEATASRAIIPVSSSEINTSVKTTLDSLYITNEDPAYKTAHGTYRKTIITKDEWNTWINHSDRSSKKSLSYNLTWS